jgi:hypothetical protein
MWFLAAEYNKLPLVSQTKNRTLREPAFWRRLVRSTALQAYGNGKQSRTTCGSVGPRDLSSIAALAAASTKENGALASLHLPQGDIKRFFCFF